jgi:hypothetical protein
MKSTFLIFVICLAVSCIAANVRVAAYQQDGPAKKQAPPSLSKQLIGRWENNATGMDVLEGGGIVFYKEGRKRVYHQTLYKLVSPNTVLLQQAGGAQKWVVKRLVGDDLTVEVAGKQQKFKRIKVSPASRKTPAAQCETNMRSILIAEEQYMIDHAKYKPVGAGESFVKPGLLGKEPHCPSGGSYTVVIDAEGKLAVHCSVKEHDFGGQGLK